MSKLKDTLPERFRPQFIDQLDGRTQTARVLRERLESLERDLGGDLSYQKQSLTRRTIWLESWIETQEAKAAQGEDIDIARQVQAMNSLIGLYRLLGIERQARDALTLHEYLADRARQKEGGSE